MKLPAVGVQLLSGLNSHVNQVQQLVAYKLRHCAVHLTGPTDMELQDQVAVRKGVLCKRILPRVGRADEQAQIAKGEEARQGDAITCQTTLDL